MRKTIILLTLAFSLFLGACASSPEATVVNVTPTPGTVSRLIEPGPTVARPTPTESRSAATRPDAIEWDKAGLYIGKFKTVCGPVVSARYASSSAGQPTFLNIGKDYPAPERFTVVIWGKNRGNFPFKPEDYYTGKTVCVAGLIKEYGGVPEIEVSSPSQIEVPAMPGPIAKPTPGI